MLYTGHNVLDNYKRFKQYPALMMDKYDRNETTFPKIRVCSHSQHSAHKLQTTYVSHFDEQWTMIHNIKSNISKSIMERFYGYASNGREREAWDKLVITRKGISQNV